MSNRFVFLHKYNFLAATTVNFFFSAHYLLLLHFLFIITTISNEEACAILSDTPYATQLKCITQILVTDSKLNPNALSFIAKSLKIADRVVIPSYADNIPTHVDNCLVENVHDKCVPIYSCQHLHEHTSSNINTNCIPGCVITANGLRYMEHAFLITHTTLTCITFSATLSILIIYFILMCDYPMYDEPYYILKDLKLRNANNIISAQLNINSIRNKFDQLKGMVTGNIDNLILTET